MLRDSFCFADCNVDDSVRVEIMGTIVYTIDNANAGRD
jgi:hypothetical protein